MTSATGVPRTPLGANYKQPACMDSVSEGGLEPFAYVLGGSAELWLSV
jgi:hypothetical protein